jgi:hypothetical protein
VLFKGKSLIHEIAPVDSGSLRVPDVKPELGKLFAASPLMEMAVIEALLTKLPTMPKSTSMLLLRQLSVMFETCP